MTDSYFVGGGNGDPVALAEAGGDPSGVGTRFCSGRVPAVGILPYEKSKFPELEVF